MIIDPDEANPHQEPCLMCGEETAVGSVFFSDRHAAELPDGTAGFICSECVARVRARAHREGISDERLVEGSVITLAQGWF